MSNSYFRFKQFTIHQEHCAMKVCTDACLFGAWVARELMSAGCTTDNILDIGAGTGLLSLLLAQAATGSRIDAVELDEAAAAQAADNIETSPWRERLQVLQGDIRQLHLGKQYGLIVSNPPFFENDLKSANEQRNLALHGDALSLDELLGAVHRYLTRDGIFAVLLPYQRKQAFLQLAQASGFFPEVMACVRQTEQHDYFRVMLWMTRKETTVSHTSLSILEQGRYSEKFATLLSPYYLQW